MGITLLLRLSFFPFVGRYAERLTLSQNHNTPSVEGASVPQPRESAADPCRFCGGAALSYVRSPHNVRRPPSDLGREPDSSDAGSILGPRGGLGERAEDLRGLRGLRDFSELVGFEQTFPLLGLRGFLRLGDNGIEGGLNQRAVTQVRPQAEAPGRRPAGGFVAASFEGFLHCRRKFWRAAQGDVAAWIQAVEVRHVAMILMRAW